MSSAQKSDLVDLTLMIKHQTDKAILVYNDLKDADIWLPKSQVEVEAIDGRHSVVTMPEWLAKDKELI